MKLSKFLCHGGAGRLALAWVILCCATVRLSAYPPAPFHLLYGMLRDEYGTPINSGAVVILETSSGVQIKTTVVPGIEDGANYRLEVPMDSGLLSAPYMPTALNPTAPFRLKVLVGGVTYLPIEMTGDYLRLGLSSKRTRLNLTLGEDTDGDGLPDAWERMINQDITKVRPGDLDKNGMTYLQEYLAGTYAVAPENGFALSIVGFNQTRPVLEFLAVTGRTYTLVGSSDLKTWQTVSFRLSTDAPDGVTRATFVADSINKLRLEAIAPDTVPAPTYFRLKLQ